MIKQTVLDRRRVLKAFWRTIGRYTAFFTLVAWGIIALIRIIRGITILYLISFLLILSVFIVLEIRRRRPHPMFQDGDR